MDGLRNTRSATTNQTSANHKSAAARLQAKKNVTTTSAAIEGPKQSAQGEKRTSRDLKGDELSRNSRKRARAMPQEEQTHSQPGMGAAGNVSDRDDVIMGPADIHMDIDVDVIPIESHAKADDDKQPSCDKSPSKKGDQTLPPARSRTLYHKQVSAPSHLHAMISSSQKNSETLVPPNLSITLSQNNVSDRLISQATHDDLVHHQGPATATPRPARRWAKNLPDASAISSPSDLPMASLLLQSTKRPTGLGKSKSDLGQRRTKLVDRLKALAQSSDEEDETDINVNKTISTWTPISSAKASSPPHSQSQQPQPTQTARPGPPKITYAKSRSHLEDSGDNNLLLEMIAPSPLSGTGSKSSAGRIGRSPQKSSWDFEDDDLSGPKTQQFRSIHELRANGDHVRFLHDVSNLMDDISDQKYSARSRRRSALMELSLRLMDKGFAQKFCRHGHEQRLIAECASTPDEIADFALAATFMILSGEEGPDSTFVVLRKGGVLEWLRRQLGARRAARVMVKDRHNNMAKAAQSTWLAESTQIAAQDTIWGENKPTTITLRLIALKAMENIVRRLRRNGDASELIDRTALPEILPRPEDIENMAHDESSLFEIAIVISVLEASTIPSIASDWSSDLIERIILILTSPTLQDKKAQHTYFLTLRLCHNLINDNTTNRAYFCDSAPAMTHLLLGVHNGLQRQGATGLSEEEAALGLDVLVLEFGLLIVMTEHSADVCASAVEPTNHATLVALAESFRRGRTLTDEALTEEAVVANVAHGYLAVVLANLCRDAGAREVIAAQLPGNNGLSILVAAVEEFVMYHQKVDMVNFNDDTGAEVWGAFTEVLKGVLKRLKENVG
jgi:hypothetical protein